MHFRALPLATTTPIGVLIKIRRRSIWFDFLTFKGDRGEWLSRKGAQLTDCDEMSAWTSKIRPAGGMRAVEFRFGRQLGRARHRVYGTVLQSQHAQGRRVQPEQGCWR